MDKSHQFFLQEALRYAQKGISVGAGGPFGCVIVLDGEIIGAGHNEVLCSNDPTAHAEVVAIRNACKKLGNFQLTGCTVYATCEPCPMCLGALYWARPDRIIYACSREEAASIGFDDAFIYKELALDPAQRTLPAIQLPIPEISALMEEWGQQVDKKMY